MSVNSKMTAIGDAIRALKGISDSLTLDGMAALISGIAKKAAASYTPGTADQTIAAEQYLAGAQTVKGDANLIAGNIKKGVSIFGVAGSVLEIRKWDITLASDTVAGQNVILSGDSWIAQNWNNDDLCLFFASKNRAQIANRSYWAFTTNAEFGYGGIHGAMERKNASGVEEFAAIWYPPDDTTDRTNHLRTYANGNVTVSTTSTGANPFKAGDYELCAFFIGG